MSDNQIEIFKNQLATTGFVSSGLMQKLLDGLTPQELSVIRLRAINGQLGIDEDIKKMQIRLCASQAEMEYFLRTVAQLEHQMSNKIGSNYNAKLTVEGASGITTINAKKGCFVASCVFEDPNHPDVIFLREFRHKVLEKNYLGRKFSVWYYQNGMSLAKSRIIAVHLKRPIRFVISVFCNLFNRF